MNPFVRWPKTRRASKVMTQLGLTWLLAVGGQRHAQADEHAISSALLTPLLADSEVFGNPTGLFPGPMVRLIDGIWMLASWEGSIEFHFPPIHVSTETVPTQL